MEKKKFIIPIISVIAICLTSLGLSYAYWYITKLQDTTNNATTGCFNLELTNQQNEISLSNAYPITDEEGLKLKPFSFTIHNTCSIFAHYYVNLELLEGTTINSKFIATRVNNEEIKTLDTFKTTSTSIKNSITSYTLAEGYLGADDSEDYSVSLWIDEDVTLEDDILGKILKSKIVVNSEPSNYNLANTYSKLKDAILANEYQTTPEIAKTKIANKQSVDLSKTAPVSEDDLSDKGLYQATDDYGDTYYYRGKVNNNNVYFAGFYWQIVRINGDGSIRLIYNGTEKNASGMKKQINENTYEYNILSNLPLYSGYMYGNPASTNYDELYQNTNSSNLKIVIDDWYKVNLLTNYSNYISTNVGFCSDRTLSLSVSGDGISDGDTSHFGAFGRHYQELAVFKCPNVTRDLFTVSRSSGETRNINGNEALTYPIGTITYDEMVFAGLNWNKPNKLSFMYSSNGYWTMSPAYYDSGIKHVSSWFLYPDDNQHKLHYNSVVAFKGIRPVINLKADVEISGGIGTVNDPFIVKTS